MKIKSLLSLLAFCLLNSGIAVSMERDRSAELRALLSLVEEAKEADVMLYEAARDNNWQRAVDAFTLGASVDFQNPEDGNTALHVVATPELVNLILDRGARVNARNKERQAPLHTAVARGNVDVAGELIGRGASLRAQDSQGMTPLHIAAYYGQLPMVQFLLDQGADRTIVDNSGLTPFLLAREQNHREVAALLNEELVSQQAGEPLSAAQLQGALLAAMIASNPLLLFRIQ